MHMLDIQREDLRPMKLKLSSIAHNIVGSGLGHQHCKHAWQRNASHSTLTHKVKPQSTSTNEEQHLHSILQGTKTVTMHRHAQDLPVVIRGKEPQCEGLRFWGRDSRKCAGIPGNQKIKTPCHLTGSRNHYPCGHAQLEEKHSTPWELISSYHINLEVLIQQSTHRLARMRSRVQTSNMSMIVHWLYIKWD